jgi:hypothetical protein
MTAITSVRSDMSGHPAARPAAATRPSGRAVLAGLTSAAISFVVPLLAYHLIRPHTSSSAMALALAGAIPVSYTLALLAIRRRLSALGVVSVASFAVGVLGSWLCGGSTLAMNLQDPALTGLLGIACLVSIALGHPLHQVILHWMGRGGARDSQGANRASARASMVSTAIIGLAFLSHAAAVAALALTQSTSTFIALQQPVGLPFIGLGLAALFLYGSKQQSRQRAAATPAPGTTPGHDQAEATS